MSVNKDIKRLRREMQVFIRTLAPDHLFADSEIEMMASALAKEVDRTVRSTVKANRWRSRKGSGDIPTDWSESDYALSQSAKKTREMANGAG